MNSRWTIGLAAVALALAAPAMAQINQARVTDGYYDWRRGGAN